MATSQLAQTTLRSVLGKHELDEMLAEREKLNARHPGDPRRADRRLGHQGHERRDQARRHQREHDPRDRAQAEAERERRAKVIHAEGELQAAEKLVEAGRCSRSSRRRCSCAICSAARDRGRTRPRPSCSRCRWTCSLISAGERAGPRERALGRPQKKPRAHRVSGQVAAIDRERGDLAGILDRKFPK